MIPQRYAEVFAEVAGLVAATLIDLDLAGSATDTRIVFGAHDLSDASALPDDAILFNLEPYDSPQVRNNELYQRLMRGHVVWDFSERNARALGMLGILATEVPFGYHPTLESAIIKRDLPKDIDVLFYGTLNQRRRAVLDHLMSAGVTVKHTQAYGPARDRDIARAKIVLNVHYYPSCVLEMVRLSYLLANKVCIVSEGGPPDDPAYAVRGIAFSPYESLVETCIQLLQDDALRADTAQVGYDSFRHAPMAGILTQALARLPARAARPEATQAGGHICLCMIVRNEAPVIRRCLAAVLPHIDSWIVVDTGSTDGTQDIVRAVLAGKPGALHERPWVNFGHNRSEAFDLATATGAEYALVIDADDVLVGPARLPELTAGLYFLETRRGTTHYRRPHLFKLDLGWRYEGLLHESPVSRIPAERAHIDAFHVDSFSDGARSRDPLKFRRDAAAIEQALLEQPDNARYVFYLAQSYRDAGMISRAIECYDRRVAMGGWQQECWYAAYQSALLSPQDAGWADRMLRAYDLLPTRVETLYHLARYYRLAGHYRTAFAFADIGHDLLVNLDHCDREGLFIDAAIHLWMMYDEYAIAAHWAGHYGEARRTCEQLLQSPALPEAELERIRTNLRFAIDAGAPGE